MKYKFVWVYRGEHFVSLKNKISLKVCWDSPDSGWVLTDIPLKPENTLEKRKAYVESIAARAFDIGARAIMGDVVNRIVMIRDAPTSPECPETLRFT